MSTSFDPAAHPRVPSGQFTDKTNDAPSEALDATYDEAAYRAHGLAADVASMSIYHARNRHIHHAVERMMATCQPSAPEGATHLVVYFEEDGYDSNDYPRGRHYIDADGNELDDIDDDLELYDLESDGDMQIAGFDQIRDENGKRTEYWKIELHPAAPVEHEWPEAARMSAHSAHHGAQTAGLGHAGMGEMLMAAAGTSEEAHRALREFDKDDFAELGEKYRQMMVEMRDAIDSIAFRRDL